MFIVYGMLRMERIGISNMEETQYYKEIYSKFWINQTRKYGYAAYERNLVRLICRSLPQNVFEVGIGTGWPIGAALKRKGIQVDGCDIAENSVVLAQKELDNTDGIWAGDVLEYQGSKLYDVTYCVRASWYIPDFYVTLEKMISMTRPGGYIIFDVMDKNHLYCLKIRLAEMKNQYYKLLGIHLEERYGIHFISLFKMQTFLKKNGLTYQFWNEGEITNNKDKINTPKVVFCCRKGN